MEADLARYYQADLRDYWRGRMTLRQLKVRIEHLPPDSATAVALGSPGWTTTDYLIADLYQAFSGKEHPAHPVKNHAKATVSDLRAARDRARDRRKQLGISGSVLRKGG